MIINEKVTYQEKRALQISQSVIANQIAFDFNHEIKMTDYYKHDLKKQLNLLQGILEKAEKKEFDTFFDNADTSTNELYSQQYEMIKLLSHLGIIHFGSIRELIKAYILDEKAIMGIAKKIVTKK